MPRPLVIHMWNVVVNTEGGNRFELSYYTENGFNVVNICNWFRKLGESGMHFSSLGNAFLPLQTHFWGLRFSSSTIFAYRKIRPETMRFSQRNRMNMFGDEGKGGRYEAWRDGFCHGPWEVHSKINAREPCAKWQKQLWGRREIVASVLWVKKNKAGEKQPRFYLHVGYR